MNEIAEPVALAPMPPGWDVSVFADELSEDLNRQLAEIKRASLHFFDLRSAFGKNVLDLTDAEVDQVRAAASVAGLSVKCIGSPINKHPFDPNDRKRECDRLKRITEIAQALNAPYIRIFTPFQGGAKRAPEYAEIRDWLADQVEIAKEASVVLLLENDGDAYCAFPENARKILAELHGPHFQAVYDFSNAVLLGFPALPHWFPWIVPYLGGLHIKDSLHAKDENGRDQIVPAGEGEGRIREVLSDIIARGWKGPVILEPHLWKLKETKGLDGIGQFRASLAGLNRSVEGLL